MPQNCVVIGCISEGIMPERRFFRFPMLNQKNAQTLAITQTRQDAWIKALNRADFFPNQFKNARVCDLHFESGKSAKFSDIKNVDWVPSWNLGYKIKIEPKEETPPECRESFQMSHEEVIPEFNPDDGAPTKEQETQTNIPRFSVYTQTDDKFTGMSEEINVTNEEKIAYLEEMLCSNNVTLVKFREHDKKTKFFTGISHYVTLEALFEIFEKDISFSRKLSKFQIMFIVLSRLRLNLSFRYLSYQFGVAIPTISKHFHKCLSVMYAKLKHFVYWPDRDAIKKTMPLAFQMKFGDTIVVIIDCFEIFIERPSNIKAAAQCWSTYKHATTLKYLIGITPQGFISFISKGYGGRASDKFVTETSDFFKGLESGDVVMADRGFLIEEELKHRGVELQMPAFTKGKSQLHPLEIETTRQIANVRIHVERIIGQLRLKFTILHQFKFPISLIKTHKSSSVSTIDQIVTVCCALSNVCAPIVCKEEEDLPGL